MTIKEMDRLFVSPKVMDEKSRVNEIKLFLCKSFNQCRMIL